MSTTCNDCAYCVRELRYTDDVILKFKCDKCNKQIIDDIHLSRYEQFGEPICEIEECLYYGTDVSELQKTNDTVSDNVNHPSHYTWLKEKTGIEAIDIVRHFCFDIGNALKYLLRAGHKNDADKTTKEKEIEDLKKAKWYIEDHIRCLEKS